MMTPLYIVTCTMHYEHLLLLRLGARMATIINTTYNNSYTLIN